MDVKRTTGLALGFGLLLTGCQVTGGGWIDSAFDEDKKATFSFDAACVADETLDAGGSGVAEGDFQYKDHVRVPGGGASAFGDGGGLAPGTIVQFHGVVDAALAFPSDDGAGDFGLSDDGGDGGLDFCGFLAEAAQPSGIIDGGDDGGDERGWLGFFSGEYTPQPKKIRGVPRETGHFEVYWEDLGEEGVSDEDFLFLQLHGGEFGGYSNEGPLGGGNIEFEFLDGGLDDGGL